MAASFGTPVTPSPFPVTFTWSDGTRPQRMAKPIGYGATLVLLVALYLLTPILFPHANRALTLSGMRAGALLKIAGFLVMAPISPLLVRKAYLRATPMRWTIEPGRLIADWGRGGRWEYRADNVRLAIGKGPVRPPQKKRPAAGKPVVEVFDRAGASIASIPTGGIDADALGRALAARGFQVAGADVALPASGVVSTGEVRFPASRRDRLATYKLISALIVVVTPLASIKFHEVRYLWAIPIGAVVSPLVAWLYDRERAEMTFSGTGVRGMPRNGGGKPAYEHVREMIGSIEVIGAGSRMQIVVRGLDGAALCRQGIDSRRADEVRAVCEAFVLPFTAG